jgi:hypothetical protein
VRGQVQRARSLFFEGCDKEKAQNVTVFSIIVPTEKHSAFELGFLFENKGFFTNDKHQTRIRLSSLSAGRVGFALRLI